MAKTRKRPAAKVDFRKLYPDLYRESRNIAEVRAAKGVFLAVDGVGEPGGQAFQDAMGMLYALAYTTKFTFKNAGIGDFSVPALECLWYDDPATTPREQWRWRAQLRIPEEVTARALADVRKALLEKKGLDTRAVKRITWAEGRALQVLHLGPYDQVGGVYQRLGAEAAARRLACLGPGHEIYLNDPRRVSPDKIKTIVRMPVRPAPRA
jgi:hypothetical protein